MKRNSRVLWSRVDDGFYLGRCSARLVGYIDRRPDGLHTAFDPASRVVGNFLLLSQAMSALADEDAIACRNVPATD